MCQMFIQAWKTANKHNAVEAVNKSYYAFSGPKINIKTAPQTKYFGSRLRQERPQRQEAAVPRSGNSGANESGRQRAVQQPQHGWDRRRKRGRNGAHTSTRWSRTTA